MPPAAARARTNSSEARHVGVYPEDVADVASVMDKVFPPGSTAGQGK
jgi:hypothetical protein